MNPIVNVDEKRVMQTRLLRLYATELLATFGANLMVSGIFFYTQARFGWEMRRNLLLATAQGVVYVVGALSANGIARRIGRRTLLVALNIALALLPLVCVWRPNPHVVAGIVVLYTLLHAAQWPALESLVSGTAAARELSRRISVYNLVWSGGGALTIAMIGTILTRFASCVFFLIPTAVHVLAILMIFNINSETAPAAAAHAAPEPELLAVRTLAMRLSRVALPAMMAVIYSIGALMPTLPVIRASPSKLGTLLASVWMISRFFTFILLGATVWWHTRPRSLLAAALVLPLAFLGITLIPALAPMIACQIVLGLALGLIYAASLYFGMVLSSGSTEHGGYHEALIGLGMFLGPGSGVLAQLMAPTSPSVGIAAIAVLLFLPVIVSVALGLQSPRRREQAEDIPRRGAEAQR